MSIENNKAVIRRFAEEAINNKNLAALNDLVVETFIEHVPFPGQGTGRIEGRSRRVYPGVSGHPVDHARAGHRG